MKLMNRRAVVTGGASGIGEAIAIAFAQEGADVALLDVNEAKGRAVVKRVEATGRKGTLLHCDVGNAADVSAAFTGVDRQLGGIDILVNNAGIIRLSPIVDMPRRGLGSDLADEPEEHILMLAAGRAAHD